MQLSFQIRTAVFLAASLVTAMPRSIPLYAADQSEYTIRTAANEVRLAFAASDSQGHAVKTLRPADVAVADNGSIIRRFRSFRPASKSPLDLVILLDASDSVASQIPDEIAAVTDFIRHSAWGEGDKISILAFGGMRPQLLCARNCAGRNHNGAVERAARRRVNPTLRRTLPSLGAIEGYS